MIAARRAHRDEIGAIAARAALLLGLMPAAAALGEIAAKALAWPADPVAVAALLVALPAAAIAARRRG